MNIKSNLVKLTTAAALTVVSVSAVGSIKTNSVTSNVKAATTKVKIKYVPGYGVNVWDNYDEPNFTGKRIQHGKIVKVVNSAVDKKGEVWYQIGTDKWIQARYTVDANKKLSKTEDANKAAEVVSLAKEQVGKPYAWGSNGPSAFDCSGLVSYVYNKAAGEDITRTTTSQVNQGKTVSMDDLKPGDVLFWGSPSAPYHVGICVGNNQYVHAAGPGEGVVKQNISPYFYPSVAKRILN
ncbi:C40 family peptidase [Lactobacillus sp. ESL0791]|uniref:C40 family peptidase n=1 Tax=Lactobacillus sp. ESL0791 TaxID=2983234 RepID=UPI0023F669AB|nr:C40 family peptidase [Lactobacillus sp. ESL0791]MDF7639581.1 C40 family peptidase [Lactobacillus sp. ESL0791]